MKPTLNINLAGYPFTIDDDAYRLLKDYLDTIRYAFDTKDDTEDLAVDIESRIAEILIENESGGVRIVTIEEISKVIERIGKPSEFIDIEEIAGIHENKEEEKVKIEEEKITPPPYNPQRHSRNPFVRKRIFRDPQNALLGGVCAGMAAYLHIDVTIVRIATVILFFLSATTVGIAYIILWIVVPEANTPLQRMQMMGEDPTVENIGKTVTEKFQGEEKPTELDDNSKSKFNKGLSMALNILVKCIIIIGLIIAIPLLIAAGAAILGCVIAVFVISLGIVSGGMFDSLNEGLMVLFILLAVVGGAITIGIPLWLFIRNFWKTKPSNPNPSSQRALLIVWLCGIAMVSFFTVRAVKKQRQIDYNKWGINIEQVDELKKLNEKEIENIKINRGGVTIVTSEGEKYKISNGAVSVENDETENTEQLSDTITSVEPLESLTIEEEIKTDTIKS